MEAIVAGEFKREIEEGIRGKVLAKIVICTDPDALDIDIQFADGTSCLFQLEPEIEVKVTRVQLIRWKDGDAHVVKNL